MRLVAALGIVGVLVAAGTAGGAGSASRIVDRTVVCRPFGDGFPDPVRVMNAVAAPRAGKHAPSVSVYNGFAADGVSAGFYTGPSYGHPTGAAWLSRTTCSTTSVRLAFSGSGLRGGRIPFGKGYKCDVPARVLIRVRAVFTRPVTLSRDPQATYQSVAKGRIATASLAVATAQGKPIVFATVDDATGRARLFTSRSRCNES